jgi:hypothetical protein
MMRGTVFFWESLCLTFIYSKKKVPGVYATKSCEILQSSKFVPHSKYCVLFLARFKQQALRAFYKNTQKM